MIVILVVPFTCNGETELIIGYKLRYNVKKYKKK